MRVRRSRNVHLKGDVPPGERGDRDGPLENKYLSRVDSVV